jgi:hypothetical protein
MTNLSTREPVFSSDREGQLGPAGQDGDEGFIEPVQVAIAASRLILSPFPFIPATRFLRPQRIVPNSLAS